MVSFLLAVLLVFMIALGGRDQLLVARLSEKLGNTFGLLMLGLFVAAISASIMAFAGSTIAAMLPPRAADMLVAIALGVAAIELAWPIREKPLNEPTRSLGAIGIVLLARQLSDGARFVVFALAAGASSPLVAAIGGAIGGGAAIALAWRMGGTLRTKTPLRYLRLAMALCLIVAAVVIGLNAPFKLL
ncbi:MAG: hypothetical protein AAGL68_05020 [Pseudomonadota bacterium]